MALKTREPKAPRKRKAPRPPSGNFISEWFGHRLYPTVATAANAAADRRDRRCPFISDVSEEPRGCIKAESSLGVCSVATLARSGVRSDWMVCPQRAIGSVLVENATRRLFGIAGNAPVTIVAAPTLAHERRRADLLARLAAGDRVLIQLHSKLGGEVSVPRTDRSPELSFDVTVVEIVQHPSGAACLDRYGILEVQTMDFHGSYSHAVRNLVDGLRLHPDDFPAALQANQRWISDRVEGPNLSNVFKRTFYQMMLKFHIGSHSPCVGCVLAVPSAVWESWQRHLGAPDLVPMSDGMYALRVDPAVPLDGWKPTAWIYAFAVDATSPITPNPIYVERVIATDADALAHYALKVAPDHIVAAGGSVDRVLATLHARLVALWPELGPALL